MKLMMERASERRPSPVNKPGLNNTIITKTGMHSSNFAL
jgi:hypothetical protein